jgi:hypothetical protein
MTISKKFEVEKWEESFLSSFIWPKSTYMTHDQMPHAFRAQIRRISFGFVFIPCNNVLEPKRNFCNFSHFWALPHSKNLKTWFQWF